ncbi:MAG: 4Fe-4S binding protein [Chloroflexi bacterium]|nr:4Fe-4S binding protein [Chloroflexota bacterium]
MPIVIDEVKCQGVGDCVDACPTAVIEKQGDKCVATNIDECIDCEACVAACPHGAISMV